MLSPILTQKKAGNQSMLQTANTVKPATVTAEELVNEANRLNQLIRQCLVENNYLQAWSHGEALAWTLRQIVK